MQEFLHPQQMPKRSRKGCVVLGTGDGSTHPLLPLFAETPLSSKGGLMVLHLGLGQGSLGLDEFVLGFRV